MHILKDTFYKIASTRCCAGSLLLYMYISTKENYYSYLAFYCFMHLISESLASDRLLSLECEAKKDSNDSFLFIAQIDKLQKDLDQARRDGSRLRTESEAVVENVNTWVREQKQNNDRLSTKLREQGKEFNKAMAERE